MKTRQILEVSADCSAVTNFNAEIKSNKKSSDSIDDKTKVFLSGGGKINILPDNYSEIDSSKSKQARFNTGVMI